MHWKVLILNLTLLMLVRARKLTMDVMCADGHENFVSVLFRVDAAQVNIFQCMVELIVQLKTDSMLSSAFKY
jgi:hypothetical protein